MQDYGDTSAQQRVDYTELVRKIVDVDELKACDPPLYDDLIGQGFHRADFHPSDVRDKLVVDLGAHVGMFTALAVANGARSVFSVEMNPENYDKLVYFTNRMYNVKRRNLGVSDGKTDFLYPRESGSVCKGYKEGKPGERGVQAMSLDGILRATGYEYEVGEVVLKIDAGRKNWREPPAWQTLLRSETLVDSERTGSRLEPMLDPPTFAALHCATYLGHATAWPSSFQGARTCHGKRPAWS